MSDVYTIPLSEDDTAEEAKLRADCEKADNPDLYEQAPASDVKPTQDKAEKSESQPDGEQQKKSDSSEPEAERTDGRDELGRFKAKVEKEEVKPLVEGEPPKPAAAEPVAPPDRNAEREARAWQKIEQEKTATRQALAEIKQLQQQLAQQLAQRPAQAPQRFGSKRLYDAANEFDRHAATLMGQGDVEQAQQKLELARNARMAAQQEGQQEQLEAQQQQSTAFSRDWQATAEAEIQKHPKLGDPNSEEAQAMMQLLEDVPELGYMRKGFSLGVQFLKAQQDAASSSELRTRVERLEKENKELRDKTAISGGGVTTKVEPVDFDKMSLEQMEAQLLRDARLQDFNNRG